jgi:hypothetical protein
MKLQEQYNKTGKIGSLKWIILFIIALVAASFFFDFSLKEAVEDEQTQSNFSYIKDQLATFYTAYLKNTVDYLWNDIFIDLLWENFTQNLENVKNGEETIIEEAGRNSVEFLQQQ